MEIIENPPAPPPMLKEDDEETGGGYRFDSPGRNPDYRWGTGSTRDPNSPAGLASMSGKGRQGAVAQLVSQMAPQYGLDPSLVMAMIHQESSFNPMATSPKNAQGLMQLIPATAERFGVRDPYDPVENLRGGMKYFRWLLDKFDGNVALALAGYNAGEGAVMKHGGIPPYAETRDYVKRILSNYRNSQQTA
jgi:soluble lytic murein transglycosylase-like protein